MGIKELNETKIATLEKGKAELLLQITTFEKTIEEQEKDVAACYEAYKANLEKDKKAADALDEYEESEKAAPALDKDLEKEENKSATLAKEKVDLEEAETKSWSRMLSSYYWLEPRAKLEAYTADLEKEKKKAADALDKYEESEKAVAALDK